MQRIDTTKIGKKVIEQLIDAGGFDWTGWSRKALRESYEPMFESAMREQKEKAKGIMELFSLIEEKQTSFALPENIDEELPKQMILKREKELLGFYLSGHPMDDYKDALSDLDCTSLDQVQELKSGTVIKTAFILESIKTKISKAQKKFAILTISSGIERFELPVWSNQFEEKNHILIENELMIAVLSVEGDDGGLRLHWIDELMGLNEDTMKAAEEAFKRAKSSVRAAKRGDKKPVKEAPKQKLHVVLDPDKTNLSHIVYLKKLFNDCAGSAPVRIEFKGQGAIAIEPNWGVTLNSLLDSGLKKLPSFIECGVENLTPIS